MTSSAVTNVSTPLACWKIDHAAVRVPDFDTAIAWSTEKLGFRWRLSVRLAGLTFALLSSAAEDGFTLEPLAGPGAENRPSYQDLHASYKVEGWHHTGFRVDSVDAAIAALKRRGVTIVTEPRDAPVMKLRIAFFADVVRAAENSLDLLL